ncbi:MAG TPA: response regulator [Azospira sp.]|nr:response regulator [Azospira sp.]
MPIPTPARLSWPLFLTYLAAAIGGLALVAGFARFNSLHQEFLSANFDAVHGARTLLKARFFVDIAARDVEAAAQAPERRGELLTSAGKRLLSAENYAAEGRDSEPAARETLTGRINGTRHEVDRLARLVSQDHESAAFVRLATEMRRLAHDLDAAELDRWGNLSALNTELTARMRTMNLLIVAAFFLFVVVMLTLAWALRRTRIAEAELKLAKHETEATQQTTLDASPIGIAFIDTADRENCRILAANRQMAAIFGYDTETLPGLGIRRLYASQESYEQFSRTASERLASGEVLRQEMVMLRRGGMPFWCALSVKAIDPENIGRGVVWTCEDVSVRKAAEAELQQERSRAEAASLAKSEFLANMSHELRTPFAGLFGLLGLLRSSPLDDSQRRYLQLANDSATQMQAIVNDILDFSKIEAGKLIIESAPFDLRRLLGGAAEMHAAAAERKGLRFALDLVEPMTRCVVGDPVRLRQILDNLLNNAIKFTERGEVRLIVQARPVGAQVQLRIAVEDTGIGIPPRVQATIFEKFTQADSSTTRLYGGTGLGLAISKQLATLMGGQIAVSSREGAGSRFSLMLQLPVADDAACADAQALGAADRLDDVVVLLAEDNAINRGMLAETLERYGAVVWTAENGEEAVALAAEHSPDVILMDCQMPKMDGLEAARRIRAGESAGRQVPIIALTAFSTSNFREDCLDAGMNRFLAKPVTGDALLAEIASLLRRKIPAPAPVPRVRQLPVATSATAPAVSPAPVPALVSATPPDTLPPAHFAARLLLVEDNLPILEATRGLLERFGCTVVAADSGSAALARLAETVDRPAASPQFDLILLDCQMPILDGLETARRWRAIERERRLPPLPIIALTADERSAVLARCRDAGMDDALSKPFTEGELQALLAEWLH